MHGDGVRAAQVTKLTEKNYLRTLENAVRFGRWVLMENVLETLRCVARALLLQQTFVQGGTKMIKIGDSTIPYECGVLVAMHGALGAVRTASRPGVTMACLHEDGVPADASLLETPSTRRSTRITDRVESIAPACTQNHK